ncbi:MAG: hypothetical protein R2828_32310 [Saprospiraceae bacterium]
MEKGRKKMFNVLLILMLLAGAVVLSNQFLRNKVSFSINDWEGAWEITYFYEKEAELPYSGTIYLTVRDTLSGYMEVFPPKSTRPEKLNLQELVIAKNKAELTGKVIHDSYKINGGYLQESFQLRLEKPGYFSGQGKCLEFCAEGTKDLKIIWEGTRALSPN